MQSTGWSPSAATSSTTVMRRTLAPGSLPWQPDFRPRRSRGGELTPSLVEQLMEIIELQAGQASELVWYRAL
jgi:hypothetical protein